MKDAGVMLNPLINPIFESVIMRGLIVFLIGFLLIIILNKGFKDLWKKEVGKRYLSWLIIAPIYLFATLFGGYISLLFLLIVMFISIEEIAHVTKIKKQYVVALQILSVLSIFVASSFPAYFYSLPILYFLIFTLLGIRENDAEKSFFNSATAIFFSIWIIFSLCHFVLLGHLNNNLDESKSLLILLGFAVPLSDIFAFVIGKLLGKFNLTKTKIASNLSPNKAYSGVLGNIIGAGLGIGIMYFAIKTYMPWYLWVILAIIIGVMGVIGDITESMFKRYYHTKDSSHLIPGHGGILDRIDSALRVIIVLYYFLLFFI